MRVFVTLTGLACTLTAATSIYLTAARIGPQQDGYYIRGELIVTIEYSLENPASWTHGRDVMGYAQQRANETGMDYLVSGMGHVWVRVGNNEATMQLLDYDGTDYVGAPLFGGIHAIVRPVRNA